MPYQIGTAPSMANNPRGILYINHFLTPMMPQDHGQLGLFAQPEQSVRPVSAQPPQPAPPKTKQQTPGIAVCVLGSGSGGNCTVFTITQPDGERQAMLIDAGLGLSHTRKKLDEAGLALSDIRAICVTHFDRDHFKPALLKTMTQLGITLHCHHRHLNRLHQTPGAAQLFNAGLVEPFSSGILIPMPGIITRTVRLQHDAQGTIAYRFSTRFGDVGFATDLGHVPAAMIDLFAGVDILCIESNYDQHMTVTSPRPAWLNRRNLSDAGHLSNEQSLAAVRAIRQQSPHGNPRQIVLLHRSSQCNHPMKIRRVFERDPAIARCITQTHQRRRTRWIKVRPMREVLRRQMCLISVTA